MLFDIYFKQRKISSVNNIDIICNHYNPNV